MYALLRDFSIAKVQVNNKPGDFLFDSGGARHAKSRLFSSREAAEAKARDWLEKQEAQLAQMLRLHERRKQSVAAYKPAKTTE